MMATKKAQATVVARSQQQVSENESFPHGVESPYRTGWEHALTKKYGTRGKTWTSTKSEPRWTVRFRDPEAAAWFKDAWTVVANA
jgi:hypothetical protein